MPTLTVYSSLDGTAANWHGTYETARGGTGNQSSSTTGQNMSVYQLHTDNYWISQAFMEFDTSSLPDNAVIDSVTATFYCSYNGNPNGTTPRDFDIRIRYRDFGATIEGGDYVAGNSLSGITLAATKAKTAIDDFANNVWTFTDTTGISKTGVTRLMMNISLTESAGNPPADPVPGGSTATEGTEVAATEHANTDPTLTINYTIPANVRPQMML